MEPQDQEASLRVLGELTLRATVDPFVVAVAKKVVAECASRDDACELDAIYNAVKYGDPNVAPLRRGFKYIADPRFADYFTSPVDALRACLKGVCGGDCLPGETLVLGAGYKPIAIADVKPGDVVMGDGKWVRVTAWWEKGVLSTLDFKLRNGCTLRCTADHKVFVVPKGATRVEAHEIRAGDLRPGDELLTAETLPAGREALDLDRAWLLGLHVADGWIDYSRTDGRALRVGISAKDGWRKEPNKERLEKLCAQWGLDSRWHERYLAINDEDTATWLAACGRGAAAKHLPSLDFDGRTVDAILSGLAADADIRNGVFSSISPTLALQYRLMLRMKGVSAHVTRVDRHGGLGSNPIYRVTPRRSEGFQAERFKNARVVSISEGPTTPVFDIEVEGHRFYLPETDLIVHNCDDHVGVVCALAGALGWRTGLRAWGPRGSGGYSHVYPVVAYPKRPPWSSAVALDTTVPEFGAGDEPPRGNVLTAWLS